MVNNPSFNKELSLQKNDFYFAEVIESCLENFTAQCWQWNVFPEFGSLVEVINKEKSILGIVTNIQTGSIDPQRQTFAYKKTEAELLKEQPQIFEFLKTTFTVQNIGFIEHKNRNDIIYLLPKEPCKIHSFIKNASLNDCKNFYKNSNFLHPLFSFSNQLSNIDELLLSILKHLNDKKILTRKLFDSFCKNFSLVTGNDYRRLKIFLKRVKSLSLSFIK